MGRGATCRPYALSQCRSFFEQRARVLFMPALEPRLPEGLLLNLALDMGYGTEEGSDMSSWQETKKEARAVTRVGSGTRDAVAVGREFIKRIAA